ncbi:MAG: molybdopterin-dependent oxidoreductase [Chromatiales bacterium]|jgi:molybdopterin-containing oxidoreductase family iron-sulfur binding subunit|nr:molybdopterin-dependent oxidoreductase [Chromatiales bacterium]
MNLEMKRREFLKVMGWTGAGLAVAACDRPSFITSREGRNHVVSYLEPEEFAIPGVGVTYASTCQQCPSACGVNARVREGRVLKLEGNLNSPLNKGKLCAVGQASLQNHYNPDRITKPRVRRDGRLVEIGWDDALALLREKIGPDAGLNGKRFAWMTDTISGHQAVLVDALMESLGSNNHYVYEPINSAVWRAVCRDMLGDENPRLGIEKARVVLSFGADFLSTWGGAVSGSARYAEFRNAPRGVLIAAESKMTQTGANADLWVPVRPGSEGVLALGIANVLASSHGRDLSALPASVRAQIDAHDAAKVAGITGTSEEHIKRIAELLHERSPSLVLAGASAEGHEHGYDSVAAAMTLNLILGNVGRTIESSAGFPFPQLRARSGNGRSVIDFAQALEEKRFDVVFFKGVNPAFTAPAALRLNELLAGGPFKVALTQFEDETTLLADLVLPLYSSLEDWGTHVPSIQPERNFISIQQPVMEPLYPETRGFGDLVLSLLHMRGDKDYAGYEDYYAYLQHAFVALPADVKNSVTKGVGGDAAFWSAVMQQGVLEFNTATPAALVAKPVAFEVQAAAAEGNGYFLLPSANPNLWDGRHANLPWIQELPDTISKAVWDSWAEIHPKTAAKLGDVKTGDVLRIASEHGTLEVRAFVYRGMHPDAIAIPVGQGHTAYGRYAKGRGVNPYAILATAQDRKTGEPAHHMTRVNASVIRRADVTWNNGSGMDRLVVQGGSSTQVGRKLVVTVSADQFERTEGGRA